MKNSESPRKTVLALCYYFPPIHSIGVVRNYNMCNQFYRNNFPVYVLSTNNIKRFAKDEVEVEHLNVKYLPTIDYRAISSWFKRRKTIHYSDALKSNKVVNWFIRLINSFPFNLIIGEGGLWYILAALIKSRKILIKAPDSIIYSSFRPYSDHFTAVVLKFWFPNTFWIADFRDLHVDGNTNSVIFYRLQHWFNRVIINKADVITTVSEGLAKKLRNEKNKVHVLLNGINISDRTRTSIELPMFTISYTGSLYGFVRNPTLIFKAINELIIEGKVEANLINLQYAGKDGAIWQSYVEKYNGNKWSSILGIIPRVKALEVQEQSHINVVLTEAQKNMSGILTGKLFENVSARRPILSIINGVRDIEIERLFDDLKLGLIAYNEELPKVKMFIYDAYKNWTLNGSTVLIDNEHLILKYNWDNLFSNFLTKLNLSNAET